MHVDDHKMKIYKKELGKGSQRATFLNLPTYLPSYLPTYPPTHPPTYLPMALQSFVGPWPLFQFLDFYTVGRTP
jgi:hypothetical protein